jgi:hypothetical protein
MLVMLKLTDVSEVCNASMMMEAVQGATSQKTPNLMILYVQLKYAHVYKEFFSFLTDNFSYKIHHHRVHKIYIIAPTTHTTN